MSLVVFLELLNAANVRCRSLTRAITQWTVDSHSRALLRPHDFRLAHIACELEAITLGLVIAAHRSDIEPLVSFDEIERSIAARATAKAKFEKRVVATAALGCVSSDLTR